jgi:MOSC domain-containing protein YiiM
MIKPTIIAVSRSAQHTFSKPNQPVINLIAGIGVEGDAHAGKKVKHRYLVGLDATKPNIRQVHLMQAELFDEVNAKGFHVEPGQLGENITTRGVDLLALPTGTKLEIGSDVVVELTALRNPCVQIGNFQKGLLKAVIDKDEEGHVIHKAGVMGIVLVGGEIRPNDSIIIDLPAEPHHCLEYVW